jgi:hypothetical protein
MHNGAAAMHRRRPLSDRHASLRRDTHPNEAHTPLVHQFRARLRITDVVHPPRRSAHSADFQSK